VWIQLLTLELIDGATSVVASVTPPSTTPGGVGRARFLRRGPKLPWDKDEETQEQEQEVVVKSRRKRIPLPVVQQMREAVSPIPVQTIKHLDGIQIIVPSIGTATLAKTDDEEEDLLLWLI
jgi:hypothetical protein